MQDVAIQSHLHGNGGDYAQPELFPSFIRHAEQNVSEYPRSEQKHFKQHIFKSFQISPALRVMPPAPFGGVIRQSRQKSLFACVAYTQFVVAYKNRPVFYAADVIEIN